MEYANLEGLDKKLSRLVFGCCNKYMNAGKYNGDVLDATYAAGITTFDVARVYGMGKSERVLGKWLSGMDRESVVILTKCCHPALPIRFSRMNSNCARIDISKSLDCLKTDYIDISMLHKDDERVPVGEIIDYMNEFIDKGLIKVIAASNWSLKRILEANAYAKAHGKKPFVMSSPNFSLAAVVKDIWGDCVTISGKENAEREQYKKNGMPIFAWSSLAMGFMTDGFKPDSSPKILSSDSRRSFYRSDNIERLRRVYKLASEYNCPATTIAVAYVLNSGLNVFPVLSFTKTEHIQPACKALDIKLTQDQCRWLNLEI